MPRRPHCMPRRGGVVTHKQTSSYPSSRQRSSDPLPFRHERNHVAPTHMRQFLLLAGCPSRSNSPPAPVSPAMLQGAVKLWPDAVRYLLAAQAAQGKSSP